MIIGRGVLIWIAVSSSACITDERRVVVDVGGDAGDVADSIVLDAEVTSEVEPVDTREDVTPDVPDTIDTILVGETSEDTRPGDAADTEAIDVADTEPLDTAPDGTPQDTGSRDTTLDTEPADTAPETRIEQDVTDVLDALEITPGDVGDPPECNEDNDCEGAANPCEVWSCVDQKCLGAQREGSCDDGNACTGAGTCVAGECVPGPALTCDTTSPCARATCDPVSGCGTEVVEGGFCEVPNGAFWGTCSEGRMTPPDVCSDTGVCIDQLTSAGTALPKGLVLGDWYVLSEHVLPANSGMMVGTMTFAQDGTWTTPGFRTENALLGNEVIGTRSWCVDRDGGLALDLAANHFLGQVDAAGETLALGGKLGNELLIGVRPTGNLADAHGLYNAVMTSREGTRYPVLWSGAIELDRGCVVGGTSLHPQADEADPIFLLDARTCLAWSSGGEAQAAIPIESLAGVEDRLVLRGAIGPRGEVLLFARDKSEVSVAFGMLILVRAHAGVPATFSGRTSWVTPFQERYAVADGGRAYRGFTGLLAFEGAALVNGRFDGVTVIGDRLAADTYGRFVFELDTPTASRTFSGYLSESGRFGVYHPAVARLGWNDTSAVGEVPTGSALGVLVRRP